MEKQDSKPRPYQMISKVRLVKERTETRRFKVTSSSAMYEYAVNLYDGDIEICEKFYVIFLNRANVITDYTLLSQGGISGTVVDPRILFKYVCDLGASAIALVHNHPSGNTSPSDADKKLTEKIQSLCKIMDVTLLDHLIVTVEGYFSFADEGIL